MLFVFRLKADILLEFFHESTEGLYEMKEESCKEGSKLMVQVDKQRALHLKKLHGLFITHRNANPLEFLDIDCKIISRLSMLFYPHLQCTILYCFVKMKQQSHSCCHHQQNCSCYYCEDNYYFIHRCLNLNFACFQQVKFLRF